MCRVATRWSHYLDVGLEIEFSVHSQIRSLSGGQKVKVVLGAAVWMNPHIIILDEPTNYLDRDSLGALADAIREFGGGILLVSHHLDFTTALCSVWAFFGGPLWPSWHSTESIAKKERFVFSGFCAQRPHFLSFFFNLI